MKDVSLDRLQTDLKEAPYEESLPEQHTLPTVRGGTDTINNTPEHTYAAARWKDKEPRDKLLQLITEGVLRDANWYIIDVHDCTHDKGGGRCDSWTEIERNGTIPDGI
jgi:hypothetical protein